MNIPNSSPDSSLPRKSYVTAVDRWLAFLLLLPIVGSVAMGIVLIAMQRQGDASIMFMTAVGISLLTAVFTIPCRYTLLEDALSIRCGLIFYQIPYASIRSVKPAWTLVSGPALSLRRVIVRTDSRDHILSPAAREQFIEDLQSRLPTNS